MTTAAPEKLIPMVQVIPAYYTRRGDSNTFVHTALDIVDARDFAERMRKLCEGEPIEIEQRVDRVFMTITE